MVRPKRLSLRRVGCAEVAGKGLLAPGAGGRVGNGGERGDGFVEVWVFEELGDSCGVFNQGVFWKGGVWRECGDGEGDGRKITRDSREEWNFLSLPPCSVASYLHIAHLRGKK